MEQYMKFYKLFILFFFFSKMLFGQDFITQSRYDWVKTRAILEITAEQKKEDAIVLKNLTVLEYIQGEELGNDLRLYYTSHKIMHINTEHAIEKNNKVFIPLSNTLEVIDLKVRTISPSGKIIELNKDNIKEIKNVEEAGAFKIFAVEGVEKGCEIEYIIKLKKKVSTVGREILQSEYESERVELLISTPDFVTVIPKSYNGFPPLSIKKNGEREVLYSGRISIPKKVEEPHSNYRNGLMRVEYKLEGRYAKPESKINWNNMGSIVFKEVYERYNNVGKEMKNINILPSSTEEDKIRAIERYIKSTYVIKSTGSKDGERLPFIIKNKYASEQGIVKLFMSLLELENIDYVLVLTNSRQNIAFDPDFASWTFLQNYLFYFPKYKKYLAPSEFEYRYPMIPFRWYNNYGLFITHTVTEDGFANTKSYTNFIPPIEYSKNSDSMDIKVKINLDAEQAELEIKESFGGEKGMYYQPYYSLLDEEKKLKMVESILKKPSEDGTLLSYKVENTDRNICPFDVPIIFSGKLVSSSLLQKAGSKYIFKVGDVIGPQHQLYGDSSKRVSEVEGYFAKYYDRTIEIEIPEGYTTKNLESLTMNVSFDFEAEKNTCLFKSEYKVDGNKIIMKVIEYYKRINYPASLYDSYKAVVNAAADFNKKTILFEK
jgi:hypothetical protein